MKASWTPLSKSHLPSWGCHSRALQPGVSPGNTRAAPSQPGDPNPFVSECWEPIPIRISSSGSLLLSWLPARPSSWCVQHFQLNAHHVSFSLLIVGTRKSVRSRPGPAGGGRAAFPQACCQHLSESQQPSNLRGKRDLCLALNVPLKQGHSHPTQILSPLPAG